MITWRARNILPVNLVSKGSSSSLNNTPPPLLLLEAADEVERIEEGRLYWELSITTADGDWLLGILGDDLSELLDDPGLLLLLLFIINLYKLETLHYQLCLIYQNTIKFSWTNKNSPSLLLTNQKSRFKFLTNQNELKCYFYFYFEKQYKIFKMTK